jgi:hypothetical protein
MYCYTHINQFTCVFNELQLWTRISSEHPIFLKTVASLSNVNLSKAAEDKLNDIHKMFLKLYNNTVYLKKIINNNPTLYAKNIMNIKKLINEFLLHDTHALSFYPQLMMFGKENKAWQELVKHIISEQTFMFELFKDLRQQIR